MNSIKILNFNKDLLESKNKEKISFLSKVSFPEELKRESEVLKNINKIPMTSDKKGVDLFSKLDSIYKNVKWVGTSIKIEDNDTFIFSPYTNTSVQSSDIKTQNKICDIINKIDN